MRNGVVRHNDLSSDRFFWLSLQYLSDFDIFAIPTVLWTGVRRPWLACHPGNPRPFAVRFVIWLRETDICVNKCIKSHLDFIWILETWYDKSERWLKHSQAGVIKLTPTVQFLVKAGCSRCVYLLSSFSLFYFSNPSWVLEVCKDKELLSGAVLSAVCWVMAEVPIDPPVP